MSEKNFNDPLAEFDPVMESAFTNNDDTDATNIDFDEKTNTPITDTMTMIYLMMSQMIFLMMMI